jgi:succinyl-CoA synthetase beta subunit
MNFEEHAAKPLLAAAGIAVPAGRLARTPDEAAAAAGALGAVIVKAQAPTGKRGKAGGIKKADTADQARAAAQAILGMEIAGHVIESVLVEQRSDIAREFYAAVMNDPASKGPLVLFSALGGMDIEEAAAQDANAIRRATVDIRKGFDKAAAGAMLKGLALDGKEAAVADVLARLYAAYRANDAELLEINPLAVTRDGHVAALDCKFVMDDSGVKRHEELAGKGTPDKLTGLEARGRDLGLRYIELPGDVGVLANGAGLTMTTMDVVSHHGGEPANFLEIGGEAYTQAKPALELVLSNPNLKSLVINFCGAFARTDVMTEGVLAAIEALRPTLPIHWSVHGTGDVEARAMLKDRMGVTPFETMDQACAAAVRSARGSGGGRP